jgi:uncharacterized membrane protein
MALQLWSTLKEAIVVYTGLSPTTFFTVLVILFTLYYIITSLFGSSDTHQSHGSARNFDAEMEPLKPPVQIGEVTEEELKDYDGNNPEKPLLMAIKGQIYDVSQSRYGFEWNKKLDFFFALFVFCDFGFWVWFCFVNRIFLLFWVFFIFFLLSAEIYI